MKYRKAVHQVLRRLLQKMAVLASHGLDNRGVNRMLGQSAGPDYQKYL
jgi:hypothetical protein